MQYHTVQSPQGHARRCAVVQPSCRGLASPSCAVAPKIPPQPVFLGVTDTAQNCAPRAPARRAPCAVARDAPTCVRARAPRGGSQARRRRTFIRLSFGFTDFIVFFAPRGASGAQACRLACFLTRVGRAGVFYFYFRRILVFSIRARACERPFRAPQDERNGKWSKRGRARRPAAVQPALRPSF